MNRKGNPNGAGPTSADSWEAKMLRDSQADSWRDGQ